MVAEDEEFCGDAQCRACGLLEAPDGGSGHSARVGREQLGSPLSSSGRVEGLENGRVRRKRPARRSSFGCTRQGIDEIDHVHDDNDDHCSASGFGDSLAQISFFPLYKLFVFMVFCRSSRSCCLLRDRVVRPCTGLCSKPFLQEWPRNSTFHLIFCDMLPCRTACILVRVCAFDIARVLVVALHDRSTTVLLRGIQVISCSFEVL